MPVNVSWLGQTPQHWSSYLPQESDYETTEDYLAALEQGSNDYYENSKPIGEYWDPIAQVTRGGAQTEAEQGLRQLQNKFKNLGDSPLNNMGLQSWIGLHPELARAAYNAYDGLGQSPLDPALLALIERTLGIEAKPAGPRNIGDRLPDDAFDNPPTISHGGNVAPLPPPVSITTTPYTVYGSNGEQKVNIIDGSGDGTSQGAVQGSDGNWYVKNPDGTVSQAFYPSDSGPGSAYQPGGQQQAGAMRPPGDRPRTESQAVTPQDALAQFGIFPNVETANAPMTALPPGMRQGGQSGQSGPYPAAIMQRLKQMQKRVGNAPFVPRSGY